MGMSYLTSLNPQLLKFIAYVGSFKHFSVQLFFYMYFATRPRPALTAVDDKQGKIGVVKNLLGKKYQCSSVPLFSKLVILTREGDSLRELNRCHTRFSCTVGVDEVTVVGRSFIRMKGNFCVDKGAVVQFFYHHVV